MKAFCIHLTALLLVCWSGLHADDAFHFRLHDDRSLLDWGNGEVEQTIVLQLMRGLTLIDEKNHVQPAVADSWKVRGKKITFHINKKATWSDGKPVCSTDFKDAWLRVLSKEFASPYAHLLFDIRGARQYHEGKISEERVGINAINCEMLEVIFEHKFPQFIELASHWVLFPVRKDLIKKYNKTWTAVDHLVVNGPYVLAKHTAEQEYVLKKNEQYFGTPALTTTLIAHVISDDQTALRLFDQGKLDWLSDLPFYEIKNLSTKNEFRSFDNLVEYHLGFSFLKTNALSKETRCALLKSLSLKDIPLVLSGTEVPAYDFREIKKSNDDYNFSKNLIQAKKSLPRDVHELTLTAYSKDIHRPLLEWIQNEWKKNLNLNIHLNVMESKQYWSELMRAPPAVFLSGITAAYLHPYAFLSEFYSKAPANFGKFKNQSYDRMIEEHQNQGIKKAQDILLKDECAVIPLYYRRSSNLVSKKWSGFEMNALSRVELSRVKKN